MPCYVVFSCNGFSDIRWAAVPQEPFRYSTHRMQPVFGYHGLHLHAPSKLIWTKCAYLTLINREGRFIQINCCTFVPKNNIINLLSIIKQREKLAHGDYRYAPCLAQQAHGYGSLWQNPMPCVVLFLQHQGKWKNLTWQNLGQYLVARVLKKSVEPIYCGI